MKTVLMIVMTLLLCQLTLSAQSTEEKIQEYQQLKQELEDLSTNEPQLAKPLARQQITAVKFRMNQIKKSLRPAANDLDHIVFQVNDRKLDYKVDLMDFYIYDFTASMYQIHARIKNKSSSYLEWVKLRYSFYNEGQFVGTDYTYIDYETYGSSGISPYKESYIADYVDIVEFDSIAFQIDYDSESGSDDTYWDQILRLESVVLRSFTDYAKEWQGVVANDYGYSMTFPKIFGCVYKDGRMICSDYTYLDVSDNTLPANSTGIFDSYMYLPTEYDSITYHFRYALHSLEGSGNLPPNIPIITDTAYTGQTRQAVTVSAFVIDPDGGRMDVQRSIEDDSTYAWSGNYVSGSRAQVEFTCQQAGAYQLQLRARDADSLITAWSQPAALTVTPSAAPDIVTANLESARYGHQYTAVLSAEDGFTPYTWDIISGALPPGLSFIAESGIIQGEPSQSGDFAFSVQVIDAGSPPAADTCALEISVQNTAPKITSADTVIAYREQPFSYTAGASDAEENAVTFAYLHLPSWLSASGADLSGTVPRQAVDTVFTVIANDGELRDTLAVTVSIHWPAGITDAQRLPDQYTLHQNYPNPFNPVTAVRVDLPRQTNLALSVYDVRGRCVAELHQGLLTAGTHVFEWGAGNMRSGIYLIRMDSEPYTSMVKCLLVR